jgi:tRNA threonylcarbamoyladenosine biosynthesis protein TsaB
VAVHDQDGCLAYIDRDEGMLHSKELAVLTKELLERQKIRFNEIDGIVVSKGPGSYTGLRIGVSFAKALCFSMNIPLIGINTLEILTSAAVSRIQKNIYYGPMIDARRMEVYMAIYDRDLNELQNISPVIIDSNSLEGWNDKQIALIGNGIHKCKPFFEEDPNVIFLDEVKLSARYSGNIAINKFSKGEFEDLAYFEPFYLKGFQAKPSKKLL